MIIVLFILEVMVVDPVSIASGVLALITAICQLLEQKDKIKYNRSRCALLIEQCRVIKRIVEKMSKRVVCMYEETLYGLLVCLEEITSFAEVFTKLNVFCKVVNSYTRDFDYALIALNMHLQVLTLDVGINISERIRGNHSQDISDVVSRDSEQFDSIFEQVESSLEGSNNYSIQSIPYRELRLGKSIGDGSFGVVYSGKWKRRNVAIKEIKVNSNFEVLRVFRKEVKALSRIQRLANVIEVYGLCEYRKRRMIVMELAERDLDSLIHDCNIQISEVTKSLLIMGITNGLASIHRLNIIHMDLRGANILICNNVPKIADFGMSIRRGNDNRLQLRSVVFTKFGAMQWRAPEVLDGEEEHYTYKSDVYSLGVVIWELTHRKRPFRDRSNDQIKELVKNNKREDVEAIEEDNAYRDLIIRCWNRLPNERPNAEQIFEEVDEIKSRIRANSELVGGDQNNELVGGGQNNGVNSTVEKVFAAYSDGRICEWSLDGKTKGFYEGHGRSALCVTVLDNKLFAGSRNNKIRSWEMGLSRSLITYEGHKADVTSVFAQDNNLISRDVDGMIKIWDINTGICKKTLTNKNTTAVSFDCDLFIAEKIKESRSLRFITQKTLDGRMVREYKASFQSDISSLYRLNNMIVGGFCNGETKLWDMRVSNSIRNISCPSRLATTSVYLIENRLFIGKENIQIDGIDLRNMKVDYFGEKDAKGSILSICARDSKIFGCSNNGYIYRWDIIQKDNIVFGLRGNKHYNQIVHSIFLPV